MRKYSVQEQNITNGSATLRRRWRVKNTLQHNIFLYVNVKTENESDEEMITTLRCHLKKNVKNIMNIMQQRTNKDRACTKQNLCALNGLQQKY